MMKYRFVLHGQKCCACAACLIGCMDLHAEDPAAVPPANRRILHLEAPCGDGTAVHTYGSVACLHCKNARCIDACPRGCLSRDPETGFVVYDNAACVGCRLCAEACPFHIPRFRPSDGKMVKCDGCNERVKKGLSPACVLACPFGALECVPEEDYRPAEDAQPRLLAQLARE